MSRCQFRFQILPAAPARPYTAGRQAGRQYSPSGSTGCDIGLLSGLQIRRTRRPISNYVIVMLTSNYTSPLLAGIGGGVGPQDTQYLHVQIVIRIFSEHDNIQSQFRIHIRPFPPSRLLWSVFLINILPKSPVSPSLPALPPPSTAQKVVL